eukprot:COSAG04_NODE_171_length_21611_cov_4.302808_13_plen_140_part_00
MILWHSFICHTGSEVSAAAPLAPSSIRGLNEAAGQNITDTPRVAVFSRFHRPGAKRPSPIKGHDNAGISRAEKDLGSYMTAADYEPWDSPAREEPWYEVPSDLWKYWSAEMREAAASVSAADDAEFAAMAQEQVAAARL